MLYAFFSVLTGLTAAAVVADAGCQIEIILHTTKVIKKFGSDPLLIFGRPLATFPPKRMAVLPVVLTHECIANLARDSPIVYIFSQALLMVKHCCYGNLHGSKGSQLYQCECILPQFSILSDKRQTNK